MFRVTLSNMAWINMEDLNRERMDRLKKILTVRQTATSIHSVPSQIITYVEDTKLNRFGVPLFFYMKTRPPDDTLSIQLSNGDPVVSDMDFKGELRDKQIAPYNVFTEKIKGDMFFGGIISLPCGDGKTILCLKILSKIKKKTLVIVHKEFLMNQWKERINEFMPSVKVGKIQQDEVIIDGCDIVVGMIHSLAMKNYEGIYNRFGVVVSDEIHRTSAVTFSQASPKFNSRFKLGLSATPDRKDNTERVFFNATGDVIYQGFGDKVKVGVRKIWTAFRFIAKGKYDVTKASDERIVTMICRNSDRNNSIVREIYKACEKSRKCLVLSDRLEHLDILATKLKGMLSDGGLVRSVGFCVGGKKEAEIAEASNCSVIFGTFSFISEGYDNIQLDTLFLASPKSDVVQSVGRILRKCDEKKNPIVVEFLDEKDPMSMRRWKNRERYYQEQGWVTN